MRFLYTRVLAMAMLLGCFLGTVQAQDAPKQPPYLQNIPYFTFGKGVGITAPDSLFKLNIRFRMQNRIGLETYSGTDLGIRDIEAVVRRLRLRFDGFMITPRLTYVIQLSFAPGDVGGVEQGKAPNIIRDAMIFYEVTPRWTIGMGQTKLPGNRQRVNSSGDLQLVDRSIVNATFNVDRDFGIQTFYNGDFGGRLAYVLRGAISSGEGRNSVLPGNGLAYTGRFELLPFGKFEGGGDYFEGDLMREERVKLSLAGTYSYNHQARRSGGQLGKELFENRDITNYMFDMLWKYRGWAWASEFLHRSADSPITYGDFDDSGKRPFAYVYNGHGINSQLSYIFPSNYELVGRYSQVRPQGEVKTIEDYVQQYTVGVTKYIRGHRLKLQTDLTYETRKNLDTNAFGDNWQLRMQVELGI